MASVHDPVVVPAGMQHFAPNASFKLSKSVRCNVLFDYWIQVCLELLVNAQVRHSNIFRTSWFCEFCARFFEVNLRCRQIWRGAAAGHSEPLRSTGNAAGNSFSKVMLLARRLSTLRCFVPRCLGQCEGCILQSARGIAVALRLAAPRPAFNGNAHCLTLATKAETPCQR